MEVDMVSSGAIISTRHRPHAYVSRSTIPTTHATEMSPPPGMHRNKVNARMVLERLLHGCHFEVCMLHVHDIQMSI